MKESSEKKAQFAELEVKDFERICEFAYQGDYTLPTSEPFPDSEHCKIACHVPGNIKPYMLVQATLA